MRKTLTIALMALMITPAALAQEAFLRFEMISYESGESPTEVKLRIPLSLISAMSSQIEEAISEVEMEHDNIDLRVLWAEIRAAGPNDYVEINSEDTKLKISTTETHVRIVASDDELQQVTAEIPLALGDLLFGSPDDISVEELIATLSTFTDQPLLTVEGDRIEASAWIELQ